MRGAGVSEGLVFCGTFFPVRRSEDEIRSELRETVAKLRYVDRERECLDMIATGLEAWLELHDD